MIKIGDFARLSQVSVKTLRYYDEIGLLKPVEIDKFTGYRYYSVSQLPRLNRLLALKDLGLTLDQIARVLNEGLTPEQLRGMLRLKRAEVEGRVADERERLARIEARLRQIDLEDKMPDYEIVLKTVPAMWVASRRVRIPTNDQVSQYLGPAFTEASQYVSAQGAQCLNPCLALWHTPTEALTDEDAEALVPIDRSLPGNARVKVYELAGEQVAAVVHQGDFEDFTQGHAALLNWIEENGYRVAGPFREIYHKHTDRKDTITEIQFPIAKG